MLLEWVESMQKFMLIKVSLCSLELVQTPQILSIEHKKNIQKAVKMYFLFWKCIMYVLLLVSTFALAVLGAVGEEYCGFI